ncbi:MAG: type IV secretion system protein [Alphaproteobacteria bacterium]|nr:type IV secretion system protein [Alphaproteobacteria bacterium]
MVEQISSDNTKKILLEGKSGPKATVPPQAMRSRKAKSDVVVENATEKRYLWTARAFAIIFAVSVCCNMILLYVIVAITPLYRVVPYLMSFDNKEEQIYSIIPVKNIYDQKYLTEIFVREYVLLRNTFVNDIDEMELRWGERGQLRELSSPGTYSKFYNEVAKPTIEKISQYNITRNIKIASVTEVGGERGEDWWQVEFRMEDMTPALETPRVSVWVAHVKIKYVAKKVKFGERLKNPLGFTVVDYRQVKRN